MMYRPEGLKNPYPDEVEAPVIRDLPATRTMMHRAYEAGADAMLEGLKKTSIYKVPIPKGKRMRPLSLDGTKGKHGWLVFIPEE